MAGEGQVHMHTTCTHTLSFKFLSLLFRLTHWSWKCVQDLAHRELLCQIREKILVPRTQHFISLFCCSS